MARYHSTSRMASYSKHDSTVSFSFQLRMMKSFVHSLFLLLVHSILALQPH
jgi:hypothetical protein